MAEDRGTEQVDKKSAGAAGDSDDRRQALKRLGIYGFYTAPALLAMLTADKAMAISGGGIISGGGGIVSGFSRQGPVL
jgi:hypothetical protein